MFECLIHNVPKLTTLPTVQAAISTGASSSNSARTSKLPPVPAPAPAAKGGKAKATTPTAPVPAPAAKGGKAPAAKGGKATVNTPPARAPAAKGGKATGPKTVPAAAPTPDPAPAPAAPEPAPAAPDGTKCCFFNTFKSVWQPNLPLFVCDADPSGLRPCSSGKILNDTDDMR